MPLLDKILAIAILFKHGKQSVIALDDEKSLAVREWQKRES